MTTDRLPITLQEIGETHARIAEGLESPIQLSGLLARLCRVALAVAPAPASASAAVPATEIIDDS